MKVTLIGFAILSLLLLSGPAAAQDVYKWVDDDGIISFSETPPADVPAERTGVRVRRTDPLLLQARLVEDVATAEAINTRKAKEKEVSEGRKQTAAENEEIRKRNCELALERQRKYDQAHRLYRPTEGGGRDYLTDDELDNERAVANMAVNQWCSGK